MALCFKATKSWFEGSSVRCTNGYLESYRVENFEFGNMNIRGALHLKGDDLKAVMQTDAWSSSITQRYVSHYEALYDATVLEKVNMTSLEMTGGCKPDTGKRGLICVQQRNKHWAETACLA
eukprot:675028-Amphidinium_carterae.2